ncbi:MAG: type II toxin-antitoxin system HipA family toxin [Pyrinomonadaceae bacterium]
MPIPEIKVCPSTLAKGFSTYSPAALRHLFDKKKVSHILPFQSSSTSAETAEKFIENRKRISISGVQEKLSLVLDKKNLRLTDPEEHGTYILKPIPRDVRDPTQVPANEHLTMQIARQVFEMETAANGMIFFEDGEPAYITKRFDVKPDTSRRGKEDFASLAGRTSENSGDDFKYDYSYEQVGQLIRKYLPAWKIEIEKYFEMVVFNFLFMNGDAHLKNFSIIETEDGDYRLAPAYDLMNTRLHVNDDDFALRSGLFSDDFKSETFRSSLHPAAEDFVEFAKRIGIQGSRIETLLKPFRLEQPRVQELAELSFLNPEAKRTYIRLYRQQRNYLDRK